MGHDAAQFSYLNPVLGGHDLWVTSLTDVITWGQQGLNMGVSNGKPVFPLTF